VWRFRHKKQRLQIQNPTNKWVTGGQFFNSNKQSIVRSTTGSFQILTMENRLFTSDADALAEHEIAQFSAVDDLLLCLCQVLRKKQQLVKRLKQFQVDYVNAIQVATPSEVWLLNVLRDRVMAGLNRQYAQDLAELNPILFGKDQHADELDAKVTRFFQSVKAMNLVPDVSQLTPSAAASVLWSEILQSSPISSQLANTSDAQFDAVSVPDSELRHRGGIFQCSPFESGTNIMSCFE
jgi:hypothetical protein